MAQKENTHNAKAGETTAEANAADAAAIKAADAGDGKVGGNAPKTAKKDPTEGLVKMHKDGETLHIHPTTVEAHKGSGWKVA
jgi:hypothetical protein